MAAGTEQGVLEILSLPIAGLMSDRPISFVMERLTALKSATRVLGSVLENPFMALSFLTLPVIPELKLTDKGLVDVKAFSIVSLFEEV